MKHWQTDNDTYIHPITEKTLTNTKTHNHTMTKHELSWL